MQHALAIVIGIGLLDAANPATLVPALYLATGPNGVRSVAGFFRVGGRPALAGRRWASRAGKSDASRGRW